jgi:acetyl-CoA carboxylase, biotin carboxylase subunit
VVQFTPNVFRKILIANRGEIAFRVIRACKELGIRSVAVFSEADRWANYVAQADEAYPIGPAPSRESYLRMDKILEVARKSGAQAIHPGYGFLSENADFSQACRKDRIKFIGPGPDAMRALGNKIAARKQAQKLKLPVVPGISGQVDEAQILAFGKEHGFPILLKASGGGGGKGLRVVREPKDVARALREAGSEAQAAFGNSEVFVEKYVARPRHVEIQVFGDSRGRVIHLGERECSVQRRHQKLVEESPSTAVDPALREKMGAAAVRIAKSVGYENAGTCEFLLDDGRFYFLEVNSRLQVEHPVTEMVTGLDLVRTQIAVAAGEALPLKQEDVVHRGHAIEVRVCAEDPFANFAPATGEVSAVRFPHGPFTRVDSDLVRRTPITVYYDSLIAKIITWAGTRAEAVDRMLRALRETKIVGVQTTIPFHLQLFQDRRFRAGRIHTKFVDEEFEFKDAKAQHHEEAAVLAAAIEFFRRERMTPKYASPRPLSTWKMAWREDK